MFNLLKKSLLGVALSLITVLPVSAENYVSVHDNNNLWMKVGSVNAPWMEIANDSSNITGVESSGDRVAYSDADGNLWIKEGVYGGWTLVAQYVTDWDINGNQIAIIENDGTLYYKNGALTNPWEYKGGNAVKVSLSPNRIAYLNNYESYLGTVELQVIQESGAYPTYWYEADIAAPTVNGTISWPSFQVTDNRIAFISGDFTQFYVKEGSATAPWTANISDPSYTFYFQMTDNRLCVNIAAGNVPQIYCKDGSLAAPWVEISSGGYLLSLNNSEIAVQSVEPYDPLNALQIYNGTWTTLDQGLGLAVNNQ